MILSLSYIIASILFILSIRGLSSPKTARRGNIFGMSAMLIAIVATLFSPNIQEYYWIIGTIAAGAVVGTLMAIRVKITALPQMVAILNGFGGLASVFIAIAETMKGSNSHIENAIGLLIGAIAFAGSLIAFMKLDGRMKPRAIIFPLQQPLNLFLGVSMVVLCVLFSTSGYINILYIIAALALVLGLLLIIPIGGADMPVVISILNAYSGWSTVAIGFALNNVLLIIIGAIVGASGVILSYIMCKAMNRSLSNVMLGGFGSEKIKASTKDDANKYAKAGSPEDAAFLLENAKSVIIVPGYGMAVAQAQHIVKDLTDELKNRGVTIKFAIHPVAGRMPGHMNVLLAEAGVSYDDVFELDEINRDFSNTDVVYVIGANDITNPLAKTDKSSPIYGMPILEVGKAKNVFFIKRSLASGYSGVDNPLFYAENTTMLYGDAKKVTEQIVSYL